MAVVPAGLEELRDALEASTLAVLPVCTQESAQERTSWPRADLPRRTVRTVSSDYAYVMLAVPAFAYQHPNRAAGEILAAALGGSSTSLLYDAIREQRGLAYEVASWHRAFSDAGVVVISVGTAPSNVDEVLEVTDALLDSLPSREWSADEFEIAKNQCKGQMLLRAESSSDHALMTARNRQTGGCDWSLASHLKVVDRVTADELKAVASELFSRPAVAVVAGGYGERSTT